MRTAGSWGQTQNWAPNYQAHCVSRTPFANSGRARILPHESGSPLPITKRTGLLQVGAKAFKVGEKLLGRHPISRVGHSKTFAGTLGMDIDCFRSPMPTDLSA